ncbi:hypothetical protein ISX56_34370, partial [Serratia ureilytica]|nr:hypothetical protein [Serratia ureilytica]
MASISFPPAALLSAFLCSTGIGALIVFRIGSFIPIPGIDATVLAKLLEQQRGTYSLKC